MAVLSELERIPASSYDDLAGGVEPDVDGVVVTVGKARATFLPAVWGDLADPSQFLSALWAKAGLAERSWPRGIVIERYRTRVFSAEGSRLGTRRSRSNSGA